MKRGLFPAAALSAGLILSGCGESAPANIVTVQQLMEKGCKAGESYHVVGKVALLGKKSEWIPYPTIVPVTKVETYYDSQSKTTKTRTVPSTEMKIIFSEVVVSTYDLRGDDGVEAGIRIKDKEGGLYIPSMPIVPAFDSARTDTIEVTGTAIQDASKGCTIAAGEIIQVKPN